MDRSIFDGSTINTPSMLCVEDYIDALHWSDTVGGLKGLIKRSEVIQNASVSHDLCFLGRCYFHGSIRLATLYKLLLLTLGGFQVVHARNSKPEVDVGASAYVSFTLCSKSYDLHQNQFV